MNTPDPDLGLNVDAILFRAATRRVAHFGGELTKAAADLGVSRTTLRHYLRWPGPARRCHLSTGGKPNVVETDSAGTRRE